MKRVSFALLALSLSGCGMAGIPVLSSLIGTTSNSTAVAEATAAGGDGPQVDFEAIKKVFFARFDKDGDGALSLDEFKAAPAPGPQGPGHPPMMSPPMKGPGGPPMMGAGMAPPPMMGPGQSPPDLTDEEKAELEALKAEQEAKRKEAEEAFKAKYPALAARAEAEKARAEARRAEEAANVFAKLDANGDSKLTPDEFKPPPPPKGRPGMPPPASGGMMM